MIRIRMIINHESDIKKLITILKQDGSCVYPKGIDCMSCPLKVTSCTTDNRERVYLVKDFLLKNYSEEDMFEDLL